ncbi:hypothetical protein MNQ98_09250 [Paenibacillus sp. N3/727]|uniref:hypothetical protein n=1 Tax=Paenibacillus sp. N3/727 TaxID=2925845 RepID=UPI001F5360A6|nr:hypothetical protein [Paenibacillus sp. N3/727]UNK20173.1 hypothetical protein MNQ98_09250 [Paenibacillus sp. N3/727]
MQHATDYLQKIDLAAAVKADKKRGKAEKPERKPTIREQLKTDKEKATPKKAAGRKKNQDLEV